MPPQELVRGGETELSLELLQAHWGPIGELNTPGGPTEHLYNIVNFNLQELKKVPTSLRKIPLGFQQGEGERNHFEINQSTLFFYYYYYYY